MSTTLDNGSHINLNGSIGVGTVLLFDPFLGGRNRFERWSSYWLRAIDEQGPLPSARCHHHVFSSTKISTHNRLLQLLNYNPEIAKEVNALEEVTKAGSVTIGKNICLYQARIGQVIAKQRPTEGPSLFVL
ncbi:hypothetical protein Bca101_004302 [Brassica carinata]